MSFRTRMCSGWPVSLLLVISLLPATSVLAQQDTTGVLLPEIQEREVEILGEFEIAFPSLQRQPLGGFNPPPKIFEIPRDRIPYLGVYKQTAADLPPTELEDPISPPVSVDLAGDPAYGQLQVGFGRYLSRDVEGRVNLPLATNLSLFTEARYLGWSAYEPFPENPDFSTSAEQFDGLIGLKSVHSSFSTGLEADGFLDFYELYALGAEPGGLTNLLPDPDNTLDPQPNRDGIGYGLAAWIKNATGADLPFALRVRYGANRYTTDLYTDDRSMPQFRRAEKRIDAEGQFGSRFSSASFMIDGRVTSGGLDTDAALGRDHFTLDVGADARVRVGQAAHIRVGGRFVGYDASAANLGPDATSDFESALYLAPSVRVDVFLQQGLQFYASNEPYATAHGLADLYRLNPYVVSEPVLKPTLSTIAAETGIVFFNGPIRVSGHVGYDRRPSHLFFEEAQTVPGLGDDVPGFFEATYAEADILQVGADAALSFLGGFSASLAVRWRDGRLTEEDTVIPYFSPAVGQLQVSYGFKEQKGLLQLNVNAEGTRYTDRTEAEKLDGFIDANVGASYYLRSHVGVYAQIDRMSERRFSRWADYPVPTWMARAGLKIRW